MMIGGHDDRHGARRVAGHLEIGAAHREAPALDVVEEPQRDAVAREADHGDREHETRRDLGRIRESAPRLVQDERGHREQKDGVGDRRQDLETQVAEGPLAAGRSGPEPDRQQREAQPRDVGEDVAGIRQQREAVRGKTADQLDDQDPDRQSQHGEEPSGIRAGRAVDVWHDRSLRSAALAACQRRGRHDESGRTTDHGGPLRSS